MICTTTILLALALNAVNVNALPVVASSHMSNSIVSSHSSVLANPSNPLVTPSMIPTLATSATDSLPSQHKDKGSKKCTPKKGQNKMHPKQKNNKNKGEDKNKEKNKHHSVEPPAGSMSAPSAENTLNTRGTPPRPPPHHNDSPHEEQDEDCEEEEEHHPPGTHHSVMGSGVESGLPSGTPLDTPIVSSGTTSGAICTTGSAMSAVITSKVSTSHLEESHSSATHTSATHTSVKNEPSEHSSVKNEPSKHSSAEKPATTTAHLSRRYPEAFSADTPLEERPLSMTPSSAIPSASTSAHAHKGCSHISNNARPRATDELCETETHVLPSGIIATRIGIPLRETPVPIIASGTSAPSNLPRKVPVWDEHINLPRGNLAGLPEYNPIWTPDPIPSTRPGQIIPAIAREYD